MEQHLNTHVPPALKESSAFEPVKDTVQKPEGFERKTGRLATLKGLFTNLKAKMDHGRERAASALPPQRVHRGSLSSLTSHIRRGSEAVRHIGRSRGRSAAPFDHLLIKPESEKQSRIDRHMRLQTAIKTSPGSPFQHLDSHQRMHLLTALDVCTGLSDEVAAPMEGLMLLHECLEQLTNSEQKTDSNISGSVKQSTLGSELSALKDDCKKRLATTFAGVDANRNSTKTVSAESLNSTTLSVQNSTSRLDQVASPAADSPKPSGQAVPAPVKNESKAVDPAIAEFDDLDQLAMDLHKAVHKPAEKAAAPINPAIAEFDDLDQLAMDLEKSFRKPEAKKSQEANLDELDQLTSELEAMLGKSDAAAPAPANQENNVLDELDQLTQELASLLPPSAKTNPASGGEKSTHASSGIGHPPTPDQLA